MHSKRRKAVRPKGQNARLSARLRVIQGKAEQEQIEIARDRVYLGRMREVKDRKSGILRRNDLAFDESETSFARRHARVAWDAKKQVFRVLSEPGNQANTSILRNGEIIRCDSRRGVQLQAQDEICLGNSRVRFES